MSWPMVAIKDCCSVVGGATPKREIEEYWDSRDVAWVTPKDISKINCIYLNDAPEYISVKGFNSCAAHKLPKGSLLLTSRAPIGNVAITAKELCTNQGFKSLLPSEKVDIKYLYFCMVYSADRLENEGNGATFKEVSKKVVEAFKIPLPPLDTQKKIAAVLEKADQLRKDCQQMEQELNSLAQSVFIDMFGDPVTNPKGWDVKPLSDVANVVTGNTPSRAKSEYYGSDIEWIKSGNINTPSDYLTTAGEYLSEAGKKVGRVVQSGSVLMTCIAGSPDCIGNIAMADREVAFNQQINALVPKKNTLNTEFLFILLRVGKKIIQSASTNSMKGMINKSKLESIKLPFPSYDEQCDFSEIYVKLQKSVKEQTEQVIDTELLFNSLMQKAFKGELNL